MTKILVVDDESDLEILIKQKFRQKIRQQEYEFIFASNGKQALELVKQNDDLDLILSDINMPVMDGLTLLSKLSEQNSLLKSVIISAYGDMENIRTAMNRGAFDFITKPVNFQDLEITIEKTMLYVKFLRIHEHFTGIFKFDTILKFEFLGKIVKSLSFKIQQGIVGR